jgi:hypothetical protein
MFAVCLTKMEVFLIFIKSGVIYIGISKEGVVEGIELTMKEEDTLI